MSVRIQELRSRDAWSVLESDASAVLIDVRSRPEWSFVGLPDLSALEKAPVLIEWQAYPDMQVRPDFADSLLAHLQASGTAGGPLIFICRSGARSRAAAGAMAEAVDSGTDIINVSDGFEGPLDEGGHRGTVGGWKAAGLPWKQS